MIYNFCLFFVLAMLLVACTSKPDTLIGDWTADKVSVQFDENHSTPELVKQVGEMEKQNRISIGNDSILVFKGLDETGLYRLTGYAVPEEHGVWFPLSTLTRAEAVNV